MAKIGRPKSPGKRKAVRISTTVSPAAGDYLRNRRGVSPSTQAKLLIEWAAKNRVSIIGGNDP